MNFMPKITEYVSKIVQNLYSTEDAALLKIMQATLYLRAVHSVHVTRVAVMQTSKKKKKNSAIPKFLKLLSTCQISQFIKPLQISY